MNDLIIQFSILWGEFIGSAASGFEIEWAEEMKQYDTEELFNIFSEWTKEFLEENFVADTDSVEFFGEKLSELMYK